MPVDPPTPTVPNAHPHTLSPASADAPLRRSEPESSPGSGMVEVELTRILDRIDLIESPPGRRLNAFENALHLLLQIRGYEIKHYDVPHMLRMTPLTLRALTQWVQQRERADEKTLERMSAYFYRRVRDRTVREGWVRVLMR